MHVKELARSANDILPSDVKRAFDQFDKDIHKYLVENRQCAVCEAAATMAATHLLDRTNDPPTVYALSCCDKHSAHVAGLLELVLDQEARA